MHPDTIVALLVLGALFGVLGGLVGIGGGIFAIPTLGIFFGLDQQHAQGTALVMVVPNVAIGLYNYAKRGTMDPKIGFALALAALPATYLGARLATSLPSHEVRMLFGRFALAIALSMAASALVATRVLRPRARAPWQAATVIGAFGGGLSGLFGVGGAVFAVPILSVLYGISQATAQGFGLALVAPGTIVNLLTYGGAGDIDWPIGALLAVGGLFTVRLGVGLAHRLPERALRLVFAGLVLAGSVGVFRSS